MVLKTPLNFFYVLETIVSYLLIIQVCVSLNKRLLHQSILISHLKNLKYVVILRFLEILSDYTNTCQRLIQQIFLHPAS